jgi:hypothetical protein
VTYPLAAAVVIVLNSAVPIEPPICREALTVAEATRHPGATRRC